MFKKITVGFVIQDYITMGGKHICTGKEFIAGDQVDYEDIDGNTIDIDTTKEQYQPFEMKNPNCIGKDGLVFTCPTCKSHRLECIENGEYNSEVLNIDEEGDFDFGDINASGEVERFQCLKCGFVLICKEEGYNEYILTEHEEVVEWIKENCGQPK